MHLDWLGTGWGTVLCFTAVAAAELLLAGRRPLAADAAQRWWTNLALFAAEQATTLLIASQVARVVGAMAGHSPLVAPMAALPWWTQLGIGLLLLDLAAYVMHVLAHRLSPLWRLHAVHHSDTDLDVTTTVRHHPGEVVYMALGLGLCAGFAGLPVAVVAAYASIAFLVQLLAHADLWPARATMRLAGIVFVTPRMHALHHSREQHETDSNYGSLFSLWDRAFGTLVVRPAATQAAVVYGIDGYRAARFQTVVGAFAQPVMTPQQQARQSPFV